MIFRGKFCSFFEKFQKKLAIGLGRVQRILSKIYTFRPTIFPIRLESTTILPSARTLSAPSTPFSDTSNSQFDQNCIASFSAQSKTSPSTYRYSVISHCLYAFSSLQIHVPPCYEHLTSPYSSASAPPLTVHSDNPSSWFSRKKKPYCPLILLIKNSLSQYQNVSRGKSTICERLLEVSFGKYCQIIFFMLTLN